MAEDEITSFLIKQPHLAKQQGSVIQAKPPKTLRVGFIYINGVIHTACNLKKHPIKKLIDIYDFDHFGLAESDGN